jgi:hypothetical protein
MYSMKARWGGEFHEFLTLALDGREWSADSPPGKEHTAPI